MSTAAVTPPSSRNIRLLLEYDGTPYAGWQVQAECETVQGHVVSAIERVTGAPAALIVAGRTDAGVHAIGQVANFRTDSHIPAERFAAALNANLPETICVHRSEQVASAFDSRRDSQSKRYRYRIYEGQSAPPLLHRRVWHRRRALDIAAMQAAANSLLGERDFEAFRSTHCDAPHARRHMHGIDVARKPRPPEGSVVDLVFHANAFCRHMCRILAGTLVEVGAGRREPAEIASILRSRDRTRAGPTAPPWGLTLLEVRY